jgi:hypothetical protein
MYAPTVTLVPKNTESHQRERTKMRHRQTEKTARNQASRSSFSKSSLYPQCQYRAKDRNEQYIQKKKTNLSSSRRAISRRSCSRRARFSALSTRTSWCTLLPSATGRTRRAWAGRGADGMLLASASRTSTRSWRMVAWWSSASSARSCATCWARRVAASEAASCCWRATMVMLAS